MKIPEAKFFVEAEENPENRRLNFYLFIFKKKALFCHIRIENSNDHSSLYERCFKKKKQKKKKKPFSSEDL